MYIDADTIIHLAEAATAVGVLAGVVITVYKIHETNQRQSRAIDETRAELRVICYGLKGALQGIVEMGGNGPVKDALAKLDDYLSRASHKPEF